MLKLFQAGFFTLSILNSMLVLLGVKKSPLSRLLNLAYVNVAFPIGALVVIVFWGVFAIDRNLIYPETIAAIIPEWRNQIVHTLPIFSCLVDNFFVRRHYSESFLVGFFPTLLVSAAYGVWVMIIAQVGGFWVYPFMSVMSNQARVAFFAGAAVFIAFLYKLGEWTNALMWPQKVNKNKKKKV